MPNAKRASMREGPLSQLFRKTAEDTAREQAGPSAPEARRPAAPAVDAAGAQRALPHPSLRASVPVEPAERSPASAPASRAGRACHRRRSASSRPSPQTFPQA